MENISASESESVELRRRLDEIVRNNINEDVGKQIQLVAELGGTHPHCIRIVTEAVQHDPGTFMFTCFQHAFDLVDSQQIADIASTYPKVFPNSEYVRYLIDNVLVPTELASAQDGDIIVYSQAEQIRHAGKMEGGLVVSKWGLMHLWAHRIYELPLQYGSEVRYFRRTSKAICIDAFVKYAIPRISEIYGEENNSYLHDN